MVKFYFFTLIVRGFWVQLELGIDCAHAFCRSPKIKKNSRNFGPKTLIFMSKKPSEKRKGTINPHTIRVKTSSKNIFQFIISLLDGIGVDHALKQIWVLTWMILIQLMREGFIKIMQSVISTYVSFQFLLKKVKKFNPSGPATLLTLLLQGRGCFHTFLNLNLLEPSKVGQKQIVLFCEILHNADFSFQDDPTITITLCLVLNNNFLQADLFH